MDRHFSAQSVTATSPRRQMHLRQIELAAFQREDGLWDLEVTLLDRKPHTFAGGARDHAAGTPIHSLGLRVTVDASGQVLDASASMLAVPYAETCPAAANAYRLLVGLALFDGFRAGLKQRLGGRNGCSHLSEMALMLPTLAIQSFAGVLQPVRDDGTQVARPIPLDRCTGLRVDGEAVRLYFPKWYQRAT